MPPDSTADVSANRDFLGFTAAVPASEFLPTLVSNVSISLGFQTFTDGYFSLTVLPTTVPINDKTLGISYTDANGAPHGASTDTNIVVTEQIPEPASLAVLATGLGAFIAARRRRHRLTGLSDMR